MSTHLALSRIRYIGRRTAVRASPAEGIEAQRGQDSHSHSREQCGRRCGSFPSGMFSIARPRPGRARPCRAARGQCRRQQPGHPASSVDDRLRDTASIVGLGIAAYEASRGRPMVPLGAIGTGALRIGLSHQLTLFRQRSGYSVEPSIGRGSFAVTFRKRLDR
jgi:hypothetical protein